VAAGEVDHVGFIDDQRFDPGAVRDGSPFHRNLVCVPEALSIIARLQHSITPSRSLLRSILANPFLTEIDHLFSGFSCHKTRTR
jgi:hypothetical protein